MTQRTYNQWVMFFMAEGEECVRLRREFGDYISDPYQAALVYASFAAFDAHLKGPAFQKLDMNRARDLAMHMTGRDMPGKLAENRRVA